MPHGTSDRMALHPFPRCSDVTVCQSEESEGAHGSEVSKGVCHAGISNNWIFMKSFNLCKLGYAFMPGTTPSSLVSGAVLRRNNRMAKRHGGLWVGGSVELSPAGVSFKPYAIEEPLHVGRRPINILAPNIRSVRREFGWLTGTVVVTHRDGEFRFHCFGAKTAATRYSKHLRLSSL